MSWKFCWFQPEVEELPRSCPSQLYTEAVPVLPGAEGKSRPLVTGHNLQQYLAALSFPLGEMMASMAGKTEAVLLTGR